MRSQVCRVAGGDKDHQCRRTGSGYPTRFLDGSGGGCGGYSHDNREHFGRTDRRLEYPLPLGRVEPRCLTEHSECYPRRSHMPVVTDRAFQRAEIKHQVVPEGRCEDPQTPAASVMAGAGRLGANSCRHPAWEGTAEQLQCAVNSSRQPRAASAPCSGC